MLFLTPTCHSQGQPGIFRETPSHQIVELLKRSTKCLHDLLYIHHQGCAYFCREAYTLPIFRVSLVVLAFPVTTTGKQRLTCEERLFETQDIICTLLKFVFHSPNHLRNNEFRCWYTQYVTYVLNWVILMKKYNHKINGN